MASRSPSSTPDTATGSGTDPARPDTGEPLGGAGSDSDSDLGLGKFDCSAMEMGGRLEGEELLEEFDSAADRVGDLVKTASRDQLLYLYARYKQVCVGLNVTATRGPSLTPNIQATWGFRGEPYTVIQVVSWCNFLAC